MIYMEGKLRTRSWEKEGVTRYTTEVVGDNMTMLSTKREGSGGNQEYRPSAPPQHQASEDIGGAKAGSDSSTDDLPF